MSNQGRKKSFSCLFFLKSKLYIDTRTRLDLLTGSTIITFL